MAADAPTRPSTRRSQRERREGTRRLLLEATVATLIEHGYSGTTTTRVCRAAGVSQGALFKHFASKAELLSAACEHLFTQLVAGYRATFAALPADGDRAAQALELLRGVFRRPDLQAAFELYLAARTDAELRATLIPVTARHRENLRATARALFPGRSAHPEFDVTLDLVVSALQGAAFAQHLQPDGEGPMHRQLENLIRRVVAPPPAGSQAT